jgi:hypothetical protein
MKKTKYSLRDRNEEISNIIDEINMQDNDNNINIEASENKNSNDIPIFEDNSNKSIKQRHTHEFLGSTKLAGNQADSHNHRFSGVTSESIKQVNTHYHKIKINTDFFDHYHQIIVTTGPAIPVGDERHVHFIMGTTTLNANHHHRFIFTTLIDRSNIP